jgi:hypothetical protein
MWNGEAGKDMKPLKNKNHLGRVAALGCCALHCGKQAQVHHLKVAGIAGRGDWFTIPLCQPHHAALHRDVKFWEMQNESQIRLLERVLDRLYG